MSFRASVESKEKYLKQKARKEELFQIREHNNFLKLTDEQKKMYFEYQKNKNIVEVK